MSRVVVVGDALIDELRDDRGVREFVGGAALNVAVGLTRLGIATTLIAMVGDDRDGDRIRTYLSTFRVDLLATPSARGSARAVSERSGGEPTYSFNSASQHRSIVFGDAEREAIAASRGVVVSCMALDDHAQVAGLTDAIRLTRAPLFVDPNPRAGMLRDRDDFVAGFESLVPRAAMIKIGDDDATLLYRAPIASVRGLLAERGAKVIVSTLGSAGARIDAGGDMVQRGTAKLPGAVVDTMGAGDAVLASLVHSVLSVLSSGDSAGSVDWTSALERAMDVAAATVRHEGALLQIPAQPGENYDRIGT